ncbi:MAG: hypothetical protein LKH33_03005 [Acetobacter sp.]|nr:hypothetical protein [Acetobacter sp.]MCI1292890.1 hypothetical protein [Acetobacter sp.]MCI1319476.1 hypothetical protein [Acetobacter sp.]MCI1372970.1 hypothetical protein [Acetobacter sp.]MCI1412791.1 hypothetical protein [Acetobacter sp.]
MWVVPVSYAYASPDDQEELAAIKAQIHALESRVIAIEQRRQVQKTTKVVALRSQTGAVKRPVRTQHATNTATPAFMSVDRLPGPVPERNPVAEITPETTAADVSSTTMIKSANHSVGGSAIDLSSSSPLAITQTSVDRLPPVFSIGNISVRLGGFVELSNIWRDSNMTSGPATAWNNFPYANSPNHGLSEERLSAQLSRLSTLLEANPTKAVRLQAYIESDFGGAGGSSNSVQISGYVPRLRQGYFTFTQKDWGFHLLMGQAWSLATSYAKGVLPRSEQLPAVTDNNQIPGITFTRVPQIRIGKDWGEKYWLALSIEDPQATVGYSSSVASGDYLPAVGLDSVGPRVFYANSGGVLLNPETQYTDNPAPDVILKGAVDTNIGHFEVFGLGRWFRSVIQSPGENHTHKVTRFGGGVGGGMTVPLLTPKLQLTGNIIAGQGIGRYGGTLLPDTTFNSRGELAPVPEIRGALGLIGHPEKSVLLYLYGGVEAAGRRTYLGADGRQYGYGVTDRNLGGCDVEFGTCNAQTRTLASFTAGGWWHFVDGIYGSVMGGVQYTYIRKFAFRGNDGNGNSVYPETTGNTVYVTFRYLPFQ